MKTPVRDTFKSKSCDFLQELFPPASKINFFNLYGGFLELSMAEKDRIVVANTNRYVIYEFWKCALEDPGRIAEIVEFFRSRDLIHSHSIAILQKNWAFYEDPFVRAALFFLLNNYSREGTVSTGTISESHFSPFSVSALKYVKAENLYVNFYDKLDILNFSFDELKTDATVFSIGSFSYNLFEHGTYAGLEEVKINHQQMRSFLNRSPHKTVFLYEMHAALPKFYKDHNPTYLDVYGRQTTDLEKAREVVIANF